ncbi:MAG: hypothetical protein V3S89_08330, partial [Desulfobacterales bacterium]
MKHRYGFVWLLAVLILPGVASGKASKSDWNDQTSVMVTVYNSNIGLVKDVRKIKLPKGEGELRFMDVASHIMPTTVHAVSLNDPDALSILEQNYEYDLINGRKLLDKYVGKKIKIVNWNQFQDRKESVEAILLSNNDDQIYKIDDEIYLGHPGYKVLPKLPENLIAKPTLTWLYQNGSRKAHSLEVSYLTRNISWKADYVLVLNKADVAADLSGWVTVDNKSGATYRDARLKLVAGDVNRVKDRPGVLRSAMAEMRTVKRKQFKEKAFFEYHIYDLQRKTTVKDKQTKQIRLLEASDIKIRKTLLVHGTRSYFRSKYTGQELKQPVNVYIGFDNSETNHLGMPLPAGTMRLYKADDDRSL